MLVAARARRWGAPLATATNTKKGQLTKNQLSLFAFWGCKISLDHTALLEQPALQELPALLELAALLVQSALLVQAAATLRLAALQLCFADCNRRSC